MALELVTGYVGKPHITSQQDATLNAAALETTGKYIISVGNSFDYELENNTLIKINNGYAINQGRLMGMVNHDYEELEISTGISGAKRSDLVVIHYSKDSTTGIESAELRIIEGTAGEDYVDPEYLDKDLLNEDNLEDDLVLYRININGLSVESVELVANTWYLDTGRREDLLDTSGVNYVSGPPEYTQEPFYMRLEGNKCTIGGTRYISASTDNSNPTTITFDKKYAPKTYRSWIKSRSYMTTEIKDYITITSEGKITVRTTFGYPMQLDLEELIGTYTLD